MCQSFTTPHTGRVSTSYLATYPVNEFHQWMLMPSLNGEFPVFDVKIRFIRIIRLYWTTLTNRLSGFPIYPVWSFLSTNSALFSRKRKTKRRVFLLYGVGFSVNKILFQQSQTSIRRTDLFWDVVLNIAHSIIVHKLWCTSRNFIFLKKFNIEMKVKYRCK